MQWVDLLDDLVVGEVNGLQIKNAPKVEIVTLHCVLWLYLLQLPLACFTSMEVMENAHTWMYKSYTSIMLCYLTLVKHLGG